MEETSRCLLQIFGQRLPKAYPHLGGFERADLLNTRPPPSLEYSNEEDELLRDPAPDAASARNIPDA